MSSLNEEEEKFDGIEDTQSETVSSRGYKRKRTSGAEAVMTEVVSVLAHLKNRNEEKSSVQENDEDANFGQYITLEMKKIQDRRKKVQKYSHILFETQYGCVTGTSASSLTMKME